MSVAPQTLIDFACPDCNRPLKAPASYGGRSAKCKGCGSAVLIPKILGDDCAIPEPDDARVIAEAAAVYADQSPQIMPPRSFFPATVNGEPDEPRETTASPDEPPWFQTALTMYANALMGLGFLQLVTFGMIALVTANEDPSLKEGGRSAFSIWPILFSGIAFALCLVGAAMIYLLVDASVKLRQIAARSTP